MKPTLVTNITTEQKEISDELMSVMEDPDLEQIQEKYDYYLKRIDNEAHFTFYTDKGEITIKIPDPYNANFFAPK